MRMIENCDKEKEEYYYAEFIKLAKKASKELTVIELGSLFSRVILTCKEIYEGRGWHEEGRSR